MISLCQGVSRAVLLASAKTHKKLRLENKGLIGAVP